MRLLVLTALMILAAQVAKAEKLPIFDAHVHYSHDAVEMIPPKDIVALLRKAGVRRALVSSSDDNGTQRLYEQAPDIIVPALRPYRRRGEISTWMHDPTVIDYVEKNLAKNKYYALGEFHAYGADIETPVLQKLIGLAKKHNLLLHAHSDVDAVERIFKTYPGARVLWAHSGFDRPDAVSTLLAKHKRLWADLAFRSDHANGNVVDPEWRKVFEAHPDRFMVGTDTFAPERWYYVGEHATFSRNWLGSLPSALAKKIAYQNAEAMLNLAAPVQKATQ
ncbi:MAG: hypothetical protein ACI89J_001627 [Hyphomicrobiaceae bacterium]|jgi:hypothetical protein